MNGNLISVAWQGKKLQALLDTPHQGTVVGATSRGIFIRLESDWVLFLSYEGFRGPLTLNLTGDRSILRGIDINCTVEIQDGKIQIPSPGIEIDFRRAKTWEAPPPSEIILSAANRIGSLKTAAELILSQKRESGLYLTLKNLLGFELSDPPLAQAQNEWPDCVRLLQFLKEADLEGILAALTPFLGRGAGLTPAGDDMILGLLLAYHRWGSVLRPLFNVTRLNDLVIREASQKTTLISANLIACAAQGQADERLVRALDGIMTGSLAPDRCARNLLGWGNSSGCDALVGMALAILSTQP
jgi:Protein of unknown function (DUF2877)